jgi:hypothetical protein
MVVKEDWGQFAGAFTKAVRPGEAPGRSLKRMLVTGIVAVLAAALAALVYGALTAKRAKAATHATTRATTGAVGQPAAGSAGVSTWTAVAGPTCRSSAARFSVSGYYTSTSVGWVTSGSGGYRGGGCTGGFVSVPLSGQAKAYDASRYALWTFHVGTGFSGATCLLATFIPDKPQIAYVGGDPASYYVYGTDDSSDPDAHLLGAFQSDQLTKRGQWVTAVSFTPKARWVTVKLIDAGINDTRATSNAHAAAAQMRLTCDVAA